MKRIVSDNLALSFLIVFIFGFALGMLTENLKMGSPTPDLRTSKTEAIALISSDAPQSLDLVERLPLQSVDEWGDLKVEFHELGEDDNGLFIHGSIKNGMEKNYSALQIEFELLDNDGKGYYIVRERLNEGLNKGEKWNFTTYIPYSEQQLFSSYKLYSLTAIGGKK